MNRTLLLLEVIMNRTLLLLLTLIATPIGLTHAAEATEGANTTTTAYSTSEQCTICLENYADSEKSRTRLNCDHEFHTECLQTWIIMHNRCPYCTHPIDNTPQQEIVRVDRYHNGTIRIEFNDGEHVIIPQSQAERFPGLDDFLHRPINDLTQEEYNEINKKLKSLAEKAAFLKKIFFILGATASLRFPNPTYGIIATGYFTASTLIFSPSLSIKTIKEGNAPLQIHFKGYHLDMLLQASRVGLGAFAAGLVIKALPRIF